MNDEDKKYLADVLKEHEDRLYKMIKEQYIDGLEADSDYYDNFIKDTKAKLEELSNKMSDPNIITLETLSSASRNPELKKYMLSDVIQFEPFKSVIKERKLLTAPDFVRCGGNKDIHIFNEQRQAIFGKYNLPNNKSYYRLFDSYILSEESYNHYQLCGFKKTTFGELKEGDIFVSKLFNLKNINNYFMKIPYNGTGNYYYYLEYRQSYECGICGPELNVFRVVPLNEADVCEDEVDL